MTQHVPGRRSAAVLGTTLTVVSTLLLAPTPSLADGSGDSGGDGQPSAPPWHVVATGLDNPRLLSFETGGHRHHGRHQSRGDRHRAALYVAEAGRGGSGPCVEGPEGPACFGLSGAITQVRRHSQRRVVTGLPSLAGEGGASATGPADVAVRDSRYAVTIGLGNDPAVRDTITGGEDLGTLMAGRLGSAPRVVADLVEHEAEHDPDGAGPDSNPTGLARAGGAFVVTDAGGNTLVRARWHREPRTIATFPERLVSPQPPLPPGEIPMQAVPTSVVRGPDGAWYVSQLTGFPFPAGGASIWRVVPGEQPTVFASGLTNVTDLAWSKHGLYAVQIAGDAGLLAAEGLPMGSLVRVEHDGTHTTVADQLPAPYGVAVRHGKAYVTTCSVCAGEGQVVRIPLR